MSTLTVATVKSNSSSPPVFQNTSGTEVGTLCRAWVNFNGTGTVAIREQFNVSSITDGGVGTYTVNFTTAMPDANYSYSHAYSNEVNVAHGVGYFQSQTVSGLTVRHYNPDAAQNTVDKSVVSIAIFR